MTTETEHWSHAAEKFGACSDAVDWLRSYRSPDEAWQACKRGDWMLWAAGKYSGSPETETRRKLVLCACACARLALHHVPESEERPRLAIETAERWARGEGATLKDVRAATAAATDADDAADDAAATDAAATDAAATDAAYAAYAAANAAAYAANAAATAAAYAAAANARKKALAECADIVRRHYPTVESFRPPAHGEET
jgi:hypothetical protein